MFPQVKAGRPHAAHTLLPFPRLALASPKEVLKKPVGLSFPREIQDTILGCTNHAKSTRRKRRNDVWESESRGPGDVTVKETDGVVGPSTDGDPLDVR